MLHTSQHRSSSFLLQARSSVRVLALFFTVGAFGLGGCDNGNNSDKESDGSSKKKSQEESDETPESKDPSESEKDSENNTPEESEKSDPEESEKDPSQEDDSGEESDASSSTGSEDSGEEGSSGEGEDSTSDEGSGDDSSGDDSPGDGTGYPPNDRDCDKIAWGKKKGSLNVGATLPRQEIPGYYDTDGDNKVELDKMRTVGTCAMHLTGRKCGIVVVGRKG